MNTVRDNTLRALLTTWLVTATWDFVCASLLAVYGYGSTINKLWQGVASVALGPKALEMGDLGVALGLCLHLGVAFTWSALFIAALLRFAALRRVVASVPGAIGVAVVYGPLIWLAMSLVVIPIATGKPPAFGTRWWVQIFAHIPFVTLPLVFTARNAMELNEPR